MGRKNRTKPKVTYTNAPLEKETDKVKSFKKGGRPKGSKNKKGGPYSPAGRRQSEQAMASLKAYKGAPPGGNILEKAFEASQHESGAFPITVSNGRKGGVIVAVEGLNFCVRLHQLVFDNTGSATLATDIVSAIEVSRKNVDIKDIDDTNERAKFKLWIPLVMALLQASIADYMVRTKAPGFLGTTIDAINPPAVTYDVLNSGDWLNILAQIKSIGIFIPTSIAEVIVMLNPYIVLEHPNPAKRYKGCVYQLWCPCKTAAERRTAIGSIMTYQEGALSYCRKMGIDVSPIEQFFTAGPTIPVYEPSEYLAWVCSLPVSRYDGADIMLNFNEYDVTAADTWYEVITMRWREGKMPSVLYAMVRYTHGAYDVGHNLRGCLVIADNGSIGTTSANNKAHFATIAYNGTTFTIMPDATMYLIQACHDVLTDNSTNFAVVKNLVSGGGGDTLNVENSNHKYCGWWYDTLDDAWFSEINFWNYILNFGANGHGDQPKKAEIASLG
jgi:hypothetical protein